MSLMRHSGTGTMTPQDGPSECQGDQGAGYVQFYYRTSAGCVWYYFIIIFKITNCAMGGGGNVVFPYFFLMENIEDCFIVSCNFTVLHDHFFCSYIEKVN